MQLMTTAHANTWMPVVSAVERVLIRITMAYAMLKK
jgi:hypothetical protein